MSLQPTIYNSGIPTGIGTGTGLVLQPIELLVFPSCRLQLQVVPSATKFLNRLAWSAGCVKSC